MDFIDEKCKFKKSTFRERAYLSLMLFVFKTHDRKLEMEQKQYQMSSGSIVSFETIWQGNQVEEI